MVGRLRSGVVLPSATSMSPEPEKPPSDAQVTPGTILDHLVAAGEDLPETTRNAILAVGQPAVTPLVRILEDGLARSEDEDIDDDAVVLVHAVKLLAYLRAADAIEPMLSLLRRTDPAGGLHEWLLLALPELGPTVLEPALRAYGEEEDSQRRISIAGLLARLGVKDDRVFAILVQHLEDVPTEISTMHLAEYGDPRAISVLSRALDDALARHPEVDSPIAESSVVDIRVAIRQLGGVLTPEQQHSLDKAMAAAGKEMAAAASKRTPSSQVWRQEKPARNDYCWCGSQKKYKKCHMAEDEGS